MHCAIRHQTQNFVIQFFCLLASTMEFGRSSGQIKHILVRVYVYVPNLIPSIDIFCFCLAAIFFFRWLNSSAHNAFKHSHTAHNVHSVYTQTYSHKQKKTQNSHIDAYDALLAAEIYTKWN